MREPGEDDDDRDPTDLGLSAPAPARAYTAPKQDVVGLEVAPPELPPAVPGMAMSDDEIAERLRALGMKNFEAEDVRRLDWEARQRRARYFERKRREESK